jgi:hypothetical protein
MDKARMPTEPYVLLITTHDKGLEPKPNEPWDSNPDMRFIFAFWGNDAGQREATKIIQAVCDADPVAVVMDNLVRHYYHADGTFLSWKVVHQNDPVFLGEWSKAFELHRSDG